MINIFKNLNRLSCRFNIIFHIHPRTKNLLTKYKFLRHINKKNKFYHIPFLLRYYILLKYVKLLIRELGGACKRSFFLKT